MIEQQAYSIKTLAQERKRMYRDYREQLEFVDFYLPFGGKVRKDNRWVRMAEALPWDVIEELYTRNLAGTGMGTPALPARVAFGALVIKEVMGLTDEETVLYIQENHYAHYFLGYHEYHEEPLFDPSMMTHFRKRFTMEIVGTINETLVKQAWAGSMRNGRGENSAGTESKEAPVEEQADEPCVMEEEERTQDELEKLVEVTGEQSEQQQPANAGKLLIDATCCPADITYPTDMDLLNTAREKKETMLDRLWACVRSINKKPRTYRRKARKQYVQFSKKRKHYLKTIRKALGQQLGYVKRNLEHILTLVQEAGLESLTRREYRELLVVQEFYRQQREMHEHRQHSIPGRIVSISQPHVRPIKRGKAAAETEFGAKISVGMIEGYAFMDRLSWDNYNESGDLQEQVERYRERTGEYPESVHADAIYQTRANRRYCQERTIRLSGPPLGRPRKEYSEPTPEALAHKQQIRDDERARIPVEGKFGQCKRRFSMNRIMAKLQGTSETTIAMTLLIVNLLKLMEDSFSTFFIPYFFSCLGRGF